MNYKEVYRMMKTAADGISAKDPGTTTLPRGWGNHYADKSWKRDNAGVGSDAAQGGNRRQRPYEGSYTWQLHRQKVKNPGNMYAEYKNIYGDARSNAPHSEYAIQNNRVAQANTAAKYWYQQHPRKLSDLSKQKLVDGWYYGGWLNQQSRRRTGKPADRAMHIRNDAYNTGFNPDLPDFQQSRRADFQRVYGPGTYDQYIDQRMKMGYNGGYMPNSSAMPNTPYNNFSRTA